MTTIIVYSVRTVELRLITCMSLVVVVGSAVYFLLEISAASVCTLLIVLQADLPCFIRFSCRFCLSIQGNFLGISAMLFSDYL